MAEQNQVNIRVVAGAAANVLMVVSETETKLNEFNMEANKVLVGLGKGALMTSLIGGLAAMGGEILGGVFQMAEGGVNYKKGSNNNKKSKALKDLQGSTSASIGVEQGIQSGFSKDLGDLPEPKVGQSGEVTSESTLANTRSRLDIQKSNIDTINSQSGVERDRISASFDAKDNQLTPFVNYFQALSMSSKAIGSFSSSFAQSQAQLLQNLQSTGQQAYKGLNDILAQLQSGAAQLYAAGGLRG